MPLFRSRPSENLHPLVARLGAWPILQQLPSAALVLDGSGEVIFRNAAASALADDVRAERGDAILAALRDALKRIVRERRIIKRC